MIYKVIVDISNSEVDRIFDYTAPFAVEIGARVLVPFGPRTIEGYVIGVKDESQYQTKDIIKVLDDTPVILPELLALTKVLQKQNLRYIDCIRLFIPSKLRGGRVKPLNKNFITLNPDIAYDDMVSAISKRAKNQLAIIGKLKVSGAYETELNKEFSHSAMQALFEKGFLTKQVVEIGRVPSAINICKKDITLTNEQQNALDEIKNGKDNTYLLHGVTGSGKTEIYMSVIEHMINMNKTAIMLVPEISLTPQMLGVFRTRFGDKVSVLHSRLSDGERYDEWRRLRSGEASVALGARSAIFAPLQNIGAIIIDEEHDSSYVSEGNPRYFTIDIAEFRTKYNNAKLIMGSATPSIDSYLKATQGKYRLITLKNRVNNREMPVMEVVDMRQEIRRGNLSIFSQTLLRELDSALNAGNQAMIFINRRGYASFVRCRSCGYVAKCTDCDVSLTLHKEDKALKCHYCGKQFHAIDECPICDFKGLKEGRVGTEKVVSELNRIFPKARVVRMDNDTTASKNSYIDILSTFSEGQADILVGTQMIAKGHDFSNVTLVGILDADIALYFSDYRSNERTFQLITQVAGRAGREQKQGRVVLQTYNPRHFVFNFATRYDYQGFFEKESNSREVSKFPPYTKIVRLMILSRDEQKGLQAARTIYMRIRELKEKYQDSIIRVQVMKAPIKKIQQQYRFQIVVWLKIASEQQILPLIHQQTELEEKNITVFAEVNPQQML